MAIQSTYSPIDGRLVVERELADGSRISRAISLARNAQKSWKQVPLADRIAICQAFADRMLSRKQSLGEEITVQMGRPIRYTPNEIVGMADRTRVMCELSRSVLANVELPPLDGFCRFIRREPVGIVFAIVPWNYPYLTAVNTVIPALLAGNSVILKHSPQTPLCAERIEEALLEAGLPDGVFQYLHLNVEDTEAILRSSEVDFVAFTGSVAVGHSIQRTVSDRFVGVGLELGGKDPAFVRADADLAFAAENLVDGVCFNSGQSCCAIERIYVDEKVFDEFVDRAVAVTNQYHLGDPSDASVTLGPMVRKSSADFVRGQIAAAVHGGASTLIEESAFSASVDGTPYLAPQLLVNVNHSMSLMRDESFGPVVGIMKVTSDEEAVALMNDSPYGLTASIWTRDLDASISIGDQIQAGTIFMNRCDYLDPMLPWAGVKDSGRGCTLSQFGFDQLTRPKGYHLRK
jgi:acyl-CoA reductase-like NAD-dependent aldehyde dehydrogenase